MSQRTAGRQGRRERRRAARRTGSAPPQGPPPAVGLQTFLPLLVLVSAGLLAFHNSLQGPFVFDDLQSIPANPSIRGLWTALSPTPYRSVQGRPTANLSLAVNYALSGLQVWDYHAFNMAIHIAASIAMFGVVRRTLLRPSLRDRYGADAPWLAMAVALIWAVHPLQAESVTYIVQRTELLMGLFLLGTLYCLIRGLESSHRRAWYAAAVVCCALGMGSKEVMVSAPLIVVLYDRVFLSSSFREMFRQRWGLYVGLAGTWLILAALVATTPHRRTGFAFADLTPLDYARTQAGVIVHYLKLAFWPHPLVADYYDWPVVRTTRAALPAGAVVATLLGGTLYALWRWSPLGFLGAWFFLILGPTSSVLPNLGEIAAERRMYLPLAAVIVLVVICAHAVLTEVCRRLERPTLRPVLGAIVLVAIVATLVPITVRRNEDYRSTTAFWGDVIAKRPNNARAHVNLGDYLYKQGRVDEALAHFSQAIRARPSEAPAQYGLAVVLARQGKLEEAITHYSEALRINPNDAQAHVGLGVALDRQGKLEEAIGQYSEALRINPDYALAHYNLGIALANQGKLEEAIGQYSEALRINPNDADARASIAATRARQGKPK